MRYRQDSPSVTKEPRVITAPFARTEPFALPERELLDAWLDFHRATLLTKCAGLSDEQLKTRAVPSSTMTLLGILRHMTIVETWWFDVIFAGAIPPLEHPFNSQPRDDEFVNLEHAASDDVGERFLANCQRSRELAQNHPLETVAALSTSAEPYDLRWIYVHMIEEYARHNGHADLFRELIDGQTGL